MSNILDTFAEITGATRKAILEKVGVAFAEITGATKKAILEKVGVAELQKNESVFRALILDELDESRPAIKKFFPEFKNFDP
jgi:hypothetical protein